MGIKRGDIFIANLEPVQGSEQGGIRPVLILQNDIYNKHSSVTIIAVITLKIFTKEYPTNVEIKRKESRLKADSTILSNQIRTIDKKRLIKKVSSLDNFNMEKVNMAIKVSLSLG